MEKENIIIISVIVIVLLLLLGWQTGLFSKIFSDNQKPVVIPDGIILFYGEGCSHCKIVEDFIAENKIEDKVKFTKLEVWYNKDNQAIISKVAKICDIKADSVGVPFLYDGKNCLIGDPDIINFFKNEAETK